MAKAASDVRADQGGHHGPPPYIRCDIDAKLVDDQGNVVEEWTDVQELVIQPPSILVRRTRKLPGGKSIVYEDRGTIDQTLQISGSDGFGGTWTGNAFPDRGVFFTQGDGGKASFRMTSWTLDEKEQACLRVLDVKEPVRFLTEKELQPGRYYVHTADHVREVSMTVPEDIQKTLG